MLANYTIESDLQLDAELSDEELERHTQGSPNEDERGGSHPHTSNSR